MDGSSKGKPGPAGIRGVLRDNQGIIKVLFAASIGLRDSNETEFVAIVFALEMTLQQEWVKNLEIIVESDSKNAIAWVNKIEGCPWNLRFYYNKLQNILCILGMLYLFIEIEKQISLQIIIQEKGLKWRALG